MIHHNKEFLQSITQFARKDVNAVGLFYQNYIKSLQAIETCIQCFKMGSVLEAVKTIEILIECEEFRVPEVDMFIPKITKIGMLQHGIPGPQIGRSNKLRFSWQTSQGYPGNCTNSWSNVCKACEYWSDA